MPFLLSRVAIPMVAVGIIDDSLYTSGNTSAWGETFRVALRSARGSGAMLKGHVRISTNMVLRVTGAAAPESLEQLTLLTTLSQQYDGLSLYLDRSLADDTAIVE